MFEKYVALGISFILHENCENNCKYFHTSICYYLLLTLLVNDGDYSPNANDDDSFC